VPADDLTDPAPATTFAHLDATTVLSRSIAELGIYPAVDPLDSTSRMLSPLIIGDEHYTVARQVQECLQAYKQLTDIIAILGMDELSEDDKLVVARARKVQRFMSQPFQVAEIFTGMEGRFVDTPDTITGFKDLVSGNFDDIPEAAFYMAGMVLTHCHFHQSHFHSSHDSHFCFLVSFHPFQISQVAWMRSRTSLPPSPHLSLPTLRKKMSTFSPAWKSCPRLLSDRSGPYDALHFTHPLAHRQTRFVTCGRPLGLVMTPSRVVGDAVEFVVRCNRPCSLVPLVSLSARHSYSKRRYEPSPSQSNDTIVLHKVSFQGLLGDCRAQYSGVHRVYELFSRCRIYAFTERNNRALPSSFRGLTPPRPNRQWRPNWFITYSLCCSASFVPCVKLSIPYHGLRMGCIRFRSLTT
jgi:hypothetical protein